MIVPKRIGRGLAGHSPDGGGGPSGLLLEGKVPAATSIKRKEVNCEGRN